MKNKKNTIILLLIMILCVWAVIFYRGYRLVNPQEPIPNTPAVSAKGNRQTKKNTEKYSLVASYRDPFLGKLIRTEDKKVLNKKNENKAQAQPIQWPSVSYNGMIRNKSNGSETLLLTINGEEVTVKRGEKFYEIVICRIYADSIEIKYRTQTRIIKKQSS